MPADYARIHDPNRTEHYVYRLIGDKQRLLYIGCSMNLRLRLGEHRRSGHMGHLIRSIETFGPYSYQEGRSLERRWIQIEQPPFNVEWTSREQRGVPLFRKGRAA